MSGLGTTASRQQAVSTKLSLRTSACSLLTLWLLAGCHVYDSSLISGGRGGGIPGDADSGARDSGEADPGDASADAGQQPCVPTEFPECPLMCPETCNGTDDDCDGLVDEGDSASLCQLASATSVCVDGGCLIASCDEGHVDCNDVVADGCEATLESVEHCGLCNHACTPAHATPGCNDGACTLEQCANGFGDCDAKPNNGCERPLSTVTDCGACGRNCSEPNATMTCAAGACGFSECAPGFGDCNKDSGKLGESDGCETAFNTAQNCGTCGRVCSGATPYCSGGKCTALQCPADHADCDGNNTVCETDLHTLTSCGACGTPCSAVDNADVSCSSGTCITTCKSNYKSCDAAPMNGCETSLLTNTNCGECGITCSYPNAVTSCSTGSCQLLSCGNGYGNCNRDAASDGCETRLNTNADCGQCGSKCALANANTTCSSGSCQVSACNAGFGNCDAQADNGCETNLSTSDQHCGACGLACAAGRACQAGSCVCTSDQGCNSGQLCCNGSCVTPSSDAANCGACNRACRAGEACCKSNCKNLATDEANCGSCGATCGSNSNTCTNGQCRCTNDAPCSGGKRCCARGCEFGLICF